MRSFVCLLLAVALACPVLAQSTAENIRAFNHFAWYLQAALDGDLDQAATSWRSSDVEAAGRLGITYPGDPAPKVDNDSDLWRFLPGMRDSSAVFRYGPVNSMSVGTFAGAHVLMFTVDQGAAKGRKQYLLTTDADDEWKLTRRDRWLAEQGPAAPGRYVTVYERRSEASWDLPPHLVPNLDQAVAAMAGELGITAERMRLLEREKLGYLLVDPAVVEEIAGGTTAGVAMLQTDMVVTHHPHHAHELAHLLVNFWLESPPLYTLPLLQEGLAVHLGGRWGRHRDVLEGIGRVTLGSGFMTVDEMLTREGFHMLGADITYAPAGVFVGFLRHEFGTDGLRRAYLACSGTLEQVHGWSQAQVGERLAGAVGTGWADLSARFRAYLDQTAAQAGLTLAPTTGRSASTGDSCGQAAAADLAVDCREVSGGRLLTCAGGDVAVLFGGDQAQHPRNPLFYEYLPDQPYHGQTHLLVFLEGECKLYDLQRQLLVGLHSEGFWPSTGTRVYQVDGGQRCILDAGRLVPPLAGAVVLPVSR